MCAHHRLSLVRAAAQWLDVAGMPHEEFTVSITTAHGFRMECPCAAWPLEDGITALTTPPKRELSPPITSAVRLPAGALWLSPLETKILTALAGGDWLATKVIAERAGEDPDGDIRAILRNMVERGILESTQPKGFRIKQ